MASSNIDVQVAQEIESLLNNPEKEAEKEKESLEQKVLKEKFYEEIALLQKPDKVEVRAISKQQLDAIIDMLRNKTIKNNQYYYFSAHYRVIESDPPQLAAISDDEDNTTQKVVVCLEDMFDACMKIHISV